MIRTRFAQAAAVATFAVGTVILLSSTAPAVAAPAPAVVASAGATVTPDNLTWG